jgi:3-methylcrotonyl-CoA carboxylase alpha subunit
MVHIEDRVITIWPRTDGALRVGDGPGRIAWTAAAGAARWVFLDGEVYRFEVVPEGRRARTESHHGTLSAPMPATVVRVNVAPGDRVARGQTLIVLEAMKMELPVQAQADGIVRAVDCREGELVQPGAPLIELDA